MADFGTTTLGRCALKETGAPETTLPGDAPPTAEDGQCEVLVVGGGPAGSTIAALLGERGMDVILFEKDHHPRFHIGESLLPFNVPLLERLGMAEEVERVGLPKWGVDLCRRRIVAPSRSNSPMLGTKACRLPSRSGGLNLATS